MSTLYYFYQYPRYDDITNNRVDNTEIFVSCVCRHCRHTCEVCININSIVLVYWVLCHCATILQTIRDQPPNLRSPPEPEPVGVGALVQSIVTCQLQSREANWRKQEVVVISHTTFKFFSDFYLIEKIRRYEKSIFCLVCESNKVFFWQFSSFSFSRPNSGCGKIKVGISTKLR